MGACHKAHYRNPNVLSHVPLYKYVDDSTLFEICSDENDSVIQQSIEKAVKWTVID